MVEAVVVVVNGDAGGRGETGETYAVLFFIYSNGRNLGAYKRRKAKRKKTLIVSSLKV